MSRWRLVSEQNQSPDGVPGSGPHVSSVVLSADEAVEHLHVEATLHRMAAWTVTEGDDIWQFYDSKIWRGNLASNERAAAAEARCERLQRERDVHARPVRARERAGGVAAAEDVPAVGAQRAQPGGADLDTGGEPPSGDPDVSIRARTASGDIVLSRAA